MKRKSILLFLMQLLIVAGVYAQQQGNAADSLGGLIVTTLLGLFLFYFVIKKVIENKKKKAGNNVNETAKVEAVKKESRCEEQGEVIAAIAVALAAMEEKQHDEENTVLTIHRVVRPYSPWSSKIYGLRDIPRR